MTHTYTRTHIPTGATYQGTFNATQNVVFADVAGYPPRTVERIKNELITRWNRQQPTTWAYALNTTTEEAI